MIAIRTTKLEINRRVGEDMIVTPVVVMLRKLRQKTKIRPQNPKVGGGLGNEKTTKTSTTTNLLFLRIAMAMKYQLIRTDLEEEEGAKAGIRIAKEAEGIEGVAVAEAVAREAKGVIITMELGDVAKVVADNAMVVVGTMSNNLILLEEGLVKITIKEEAGGAVAEEGELEKEAAAEEQEAVVVAVVAKINIRQTTLKLARLPDDAIYILHTARSSM